MTKCSAIVLWIFLCVESCWGQDISLKLIDTTGVKINLTADFINFEDNILLSRNDNFRTLKTAQVATIFCNDVNRRTFIYAAPNDTIDINISSKGLIEYSCKNNKFRKLESEFINQSFEKYGSMEIQFIKEITNSFNHPNLSRYIDPKYIKEQKMLTLSYKDKLVSKEFYEYFMDVYWCLTLTNQLETYPISKEIISKIENSFDKAEYYLRFSQYRYLLVISTHKIMEELGISVNLYNNLKFITTNYNNQKIKDFLLYLEMKTFLDAHHERNSVDNNAIKLFKENCKNKIFIDEINQDLQPPTTPVFLQNIINKNLGKLILIDFWASWCMPCREEFPSEKKLMQKYPNVDFIFISIDKSNSAWQKAMTQYNDILNKENSFLLVKSEKDELLKKINLSTIPRFVLFGKDGKIIDVDAPRPSSKEIETLIEKYL